jgi:aspartate/methionine/tyrosine aminotransferase
VSVAAPLPLSSSALALRASVFAELAPLVERHLASGGTLVPLHIGDTFLPPPEAARLPRVAAECDEGALHRYGPIAGDPALLDASVAWLRRRGRPFEGVAREQLLVGGGATHGLFCAARALFDAGDEVIVLSPYWPLAVGVLRTAGAVPIELPLAKLRAQSPGAKVEDLVAAMVGPRTRGLYLISPNNPDGSVLDEATLRALASAAEAHGLWVIADEVYTDYVYEGEALSFASLPRMADRTVTAYSFSKSHALAGARVGLIVAPREVVQLARRVATHSLFNVPVVSQRACARALESGEAWVAEARAHYRQARDVALAALAGTESVLRATRVQGGTYLFLDFEPVLRGRSLRVLLERAIAHGVFLAPGEAFGEGFESCARLCFSAVAPGALEVGIGALRRALEDVA